MKWFRYHKDHLKLHETDTKVFDSIDRSVAALLGITEAQKERIKLLEDRVAELEKRP